MSAGHFILYSSGCLLESKRSFFYSHCLKLIGKHAICNIKSNFSVNCSSQGMLLFIFIGFFDTLVPQVRLVFKLLVKAIRYNQAAAF